MGANLTLLREEWPPSRKLSAGTPFNSFGKWGKKQGHGLGRPIRGKPGTLLVVSPERREKKLTMQ